MNEESSFQRLLGEIKSIKTDTLWMRKEIASQGEKVKDLDQRVRDLENATTEILTRMEAAKKAPVAWPAVVSAIIAAILAGIVIIDRIAN